MSKKPSQELAAYAASYIDRLGKGAFGRVYGLRTRLKCLRTSWFHSPQLDIHGEIPTDADIRAQGVRIADEEVLAYCIMLTLLKHNRDLDPGRIAIKFLDAAGGSAVEEVALMRRFVSPHVVRVLGFPQDQRWFLMERAGFNMERLRLNNSVEPRRARVLNATPLPRKVVLDLLIQLMAIAFMISVERIDHRDIAPKNVLVVPCDARVDIHEANSVSALIQAYITRKSSSRPLNYTTLAGDIHSQVVSSAAPSNHDTSDYETKQADRGALDPAADPYNDAKQAVSPQWPPSILRERAFVEQHLAHLPALILKMTDFGAARYLDLGLSGHPSAGPGTPYYLVPFQCSGNKILKLPGLLQQMLFNVCVLVHELFYGIYPFDMTEPKSMEALAAASQSYPLTEAMLQARRRQLMEGILDPVDDPRHPGESKPKGSPMFYGLSNEVEQHCRGDYIFFSTVLDARRWYDWDLAWILKSGFLNNYQPTSVYQFVLWQHLVRASKCLSTWSADEARQAAVEMNHDLYAVLNEHHHPCPTCDLRSDPESNSNASTESSLPEASSITAMNSPEESMPLHDPPLGPSATPLLPSSQVDDVMDERIRFGFASQLQQLSIEHENQSIERSRLKAVSR